MKPPRGGKSAVPAANVPSKKVNPDPESEPSGRPASCGDIRPKSSPPLLSRVKNRMNNFLKDDEIWNEIGMKKVMVQFWTPTKSINGRTILTTARGPFRVPPESFLSMYRSHILPHECWVGDDESLLGPLGRAFTKRFPEYCADISVYSTEEFPLKGFVAQYVICQFWAVPLCLLDDAQQQCIGVLEFVSKEPLEYPYSIPLSEIGSALERVRLGILGENLIYKCKCAKQISTLVSRMRMMEGLYIVATANRLPLIQVWFPCSCKVPRGFVDCDGNTCNISNTASEITRLSLLKYCTFACKHTAARQGWIGKIADSSRYSVENGKDN